MSIYAYDMIESITTPITIRLTLMMVNRVATSLSSTAFYLEEYS